MRTRNSGGLTESRSGLTADSPDNLMRDGAVDACSSRDFDGPLSAEPAPDTSGTNDCFCRLATCVIDRLLTR